MYQSRWAPPSSERKSPKAESLAAKPTSTTIHSAQPITVDPPVTSPPASALSASATAFSPTPFSDETALSGDAPPPDASTGDEFAQTGGGEDDLFDDVVVADESMRVRSDDDLFSDDFVPASAPHSVVEEPSVTSPQHISPAKGPSAAPKTSAAASSSRGDGLPRRRGGGRSGRAGEHIGRSTARSATHMDSQRSAEKQADKATPPRTSEPPPDAPTGPKKESIPSVRGDRHATGGIKRPKLTEAELAEKMAQIQIKNASLVAAHERAEADAASFAERESQAKVAAAQRQKVERRDRQQMMGEREKNRLRKLKAMEGREWDAEKNEDDFARGGKYDRKGGFAGDKEDYTDGREYLYREPKDGSGARGGSAARRGPGNATQTSQRQVAPKTDEFPALPGAKTATKESNMASPISSWADQVENA